MKQPIDEEHVRSLLERVQKKTPERLVVPLTCALYTLFYWLSDAKDREEEKQPPG